MPDVHRGSRLLAHLSRVTTRGTFIPEVDGLRFVAIAAVFLFHLALNLASRNPVDFAYPRPGSALQATLRTGELGVQLFFILSGLVLALPFARHHLRGGPAVALKAYFLRRLTRLEPPYFVVMIGCFLVWWSCTDAAPECSRRTCSPASATSTTSSTPATA